MAIGVPGCDRCIAGRILDLSDGGMSVFSPLAIEMCTAAIVTYKGVIFLAEAVYCSSVAYGYRVGLTVDQALATGDLSVRNAEDEIHAVMREAVAPPAHNE